MKVIQKKYISFIFIAFSFALKCNVTFVGNKIMCSCACFKIRKLAGFSSALFYVYGTENKNPC